VKAAKALKQIIRHKDEDLQGYSGWKVESNDDLLWNLRPLINTVDEMSTRKSWMIPTNVVKGNLPDTLLWDNKTAVKVRCAGVIGEYPDWARKDPRIGNQMGATFITLSTGEKYTLRSGEVAVWNGRYFFPCSYLDVLSHCSLTPESTDSHYMGPDEQSVRAWKVSDKEKPLWVQCLISEGVIIKLGMESESMLKLTAAGGNKPNHRLTDNKLARGDYLILNCETGVVTGDHRSTFKDYYWR
jgi:hypothetical protein